MLDKQLVVLYVFSIFNVLTFNEVLLSDFYFFGPILHFLYVLIAGQYCIIVSGICYELCTNYKSVKYLNLLSKNLRR